MSRGVPHRTWRAVQPEDEAPLPSRRVVRPHHDGLPFSDAARIISMLDRINVCGCDHCSDFRYALISYIKGLRPVEYVPDVLLQAQESHPSHRGRVFAHLVPGRAAS